MTKNNTCRGCFCNKYKKIYQCHICGTRVCKICNYNLDNRTFCIDCIVRNEINKFNKIIDKFLIREKKEIDNKNDTVFNL